VAADGGNDAAGCVGIAVGISCGFTNTTGVRSEGVAAIEGDTFCGSAVIGDDGEVGIFTSLDGIAVGMGVGVVVLVGVATLIGAITGVCANAI